MAKTATVSPSEIPEVAAFEEAKVKLQRLKEAYPEIFEQLIPLVEDYNAKLEAASKAVSARGVSCGDFRKIRETVSFDWDKLYEILGHDKFLTVGTLTTKQVFGGDKKKAEIAIANNIIPADAVSEVRKVTSAYEKPKPVVLP